MLTFEIGNRDHGRRFESFLRGHLPASPSGYARKLIKSGAATRLGTPATADSFLLLHDIVTLKESGTTLSYLSTAPPPLDVLFEDGLLLIANKPSGMPMHRTAELGDNLVDGAIQAMEQRGTPCKLYPVNRLDRGTSGAVILAKSSRAAGIFGRQVKETGLDKLYLALVRGIPAESGIITTPLDGKESETRYRTLLSGSQGSLLAVTPISGRMHQIRRHLSAIGHPIIGDKRYDGGELADCAGFALHSFRTALTLTETERMTVYAPITDEFAELCVKSGITGDELLASLAGLM